MLPVTSCKSIYSYNVISSSIEACASKNLHRKISNIFKGIKITRLRWTEHILGTEERERER